MYTYTPLEMQVFTRPLPHVHKYTPLHTYQGIDLVFDFLKVDILITSWLCSFIPVNCTVFRSNAPCVATNIFVRVEVLKTNFLLF